ncbi:MAG TPA: hypothetical protein VN868_03495 [Terriglobales bacterium]|jgi:hypothetical protein|nr:hypothetical protein [Terriglobales bacterium]
MPRLNLQDANSRLALVLACSTLLALPACNVNVKKNGEGQDQKVDIETPMGGIHVSKDADIRDVGLPVYPGARRKEKTEGHENNANVSLSSGLFGLRVAAIEYSSDVPPEKLIAYYKNELKKYGDVLECHSKPGIDPDINPDDSSRESRQLKCEEDSNGKAIELKAGSRQNQHIVSIQPAESGKGSDFALVYVQVRGGKDRI